MAVIDAPTTTWVDVCPVDRIIPNRGVCAKAGPFQVAVFRVDAGDGEQLLALSNYDPFSKAYVLSRGIVGSRGDRVKVASPVYKQSFDLRTGECLDDPAVSVATFPVRLVHGRVQVALP
ncbi:MAG: nitrite reductase small subunit NirD [Actinomycetota bacterium]|nr:nitrite reductase small subunit NirD [Actinomycetota bacterium]